MEQFLVTIYLLYTTTNHHQDSFHSPGSCSSYPSQNNFFFRNDSKRIREETTMTRASSIVSSKKAHAIASSWQCFSAYPRSSSAQASPTYRQRASPKVWAHGTHYRFCLRRRGRDTWSHRALVWSGRFAAAINRLRPPTVAGVFSRVAMSPRRIAASTNDIATSMLTKTS